MRYSNILKESRDSCMDTKRVRYSDDLGCMEDVMLVFHYTLRYKAIHSYGVYEFGFGKPSSTPQKHFRDLFQNFR